MDRQDFEIDRAQPQHQGAALWLATGGRSRHVNRGRVTALLAAEKEGKVSFDGLVAATNRSRVIGAIWCLNQPGKIATIWGPGLISGVSDTLADQLIKRVLKFAQQAGNHLMQSLIGLENPNAGEHLARIGFRHVTRLDQLHAFPAEIATPPPSSLLTFLPCDDFRKPAFEQLVANTYEGSLDCPEIDGLRQIEDVLTGYHATSGHDTRHWYLVQLAGQTIGVVILAHHTANHQLELIYFGLLPPFRQRGLGKEVIRFLLHLARQIGCQSILTGVDERNTPAMALYHQFGFIPSDSKELFLLPLPPLNVAVA
ncbi:GNAT family N-acetyltransferase [Bremerella cremea]|uniref:GNAT family N-acetyltransferase n=1 Tax=Bremerella cremea TaxID=1031537 RepID=A0A368KP49_9BACT|nr:GNAT family N-acetyltransferase [Bremerella cremea]RCS42205.1 GNAT family N-acetyltransferase [Bremerella cremea]